VSKKKNQIVILNNATLIIHIEYNRIYESYNVYSQVIIHVTVC